MLSSSKNDMQPALDTPLFMIVNFHLYLHKSAFAYFLRLCLLWRK